MGVWLACFHVNGPKINQVIWILYIIAIWIHHTSVGRLWYLSLGYWECIPSHPAKIVLGNYMLWTYSPLFKLIEKLKPYLKCKYVWAITTLAVGIFWYGDFGSVIWCLQKGLCSTIRCQRIRNTNDSSVSRGSLLLTFKISPYYEFLQNYWNNRYFLDRMKPVGSVLFKQRCTISLPCEAKNLLCGFGL